MSGILHPSHAALPHVPLTSFIGRDREIAAVTALILRPDVRLLTLTGPGGIGKTRLALRIAAESTDMFVDGVIIVSLAPVREPELVLPTLAQALDVPDVAGQPLLEQLKAVLADRPLLLVLDNLEHLLGAAAPLLADLLGDSPRFKILCTSRGRLGISGEQVFPLEALSLDTARTLFEVRAQAAAPTFALTEETTRIVDAICARLDRLPLAIELAAARISVLPPRALLNRLGQRLDLLTDGPRDAPPRLRDMREAIAWSYDLLDEGDQILFCRLGVFVGGFTEEAAQAVGGNELKVLPGIMKLVAASLVIPAQDMGDEPRFTMLETIREWALEQLSASGKESTIHVSHVHHFVLLAERQWAAPTGLESEHWLRRLVPELGNIRSALAWALEHDPVEAARLAGALGSFWIYHGDLTEGREWVERTLAIATDLPAPIRARALATAGWLAKDQNDLIQAEAYLTEAAACARAVADDRVLFRALGLLGEVVLEHGDIERAWQLRAEMQAAAEAIDEPLTMSIATLNRGRVAAGMGDLPQAQAFLEEAVAAHRISGGALGVAVAQGFLGDVLLARGDETGAATQFRHALPGFAGIAAWGQAAINLEGFAAAMVGRRPEAATRLLGAAAVILKRVDFQRSRGEVAVYDRAAKSAQSELGEASFAAAWAAGEQLSWEEVLAEVDTLAAALAEPESPSAPERHESHGLSPREMEVLRLLAEGRSNRSIGDSLSLSERTVENHIAHILAKLGLDSRTAAATYAVRNGLA